MFRPVHLLPAFSLALLLVGCGDEATATHPDKAFSDAQRASCPQSPFKAEFPIAPKRSAEAQLIEYHWDIYTSRGAFINDADGTFDPESRDPLTRNTMILWDSKDAAGRPVPSGYYFFVVEMRIPGTTTAETRTSCVFVINEADRDKVE